MKQQAGEPREGEDKAWQFGCNLVCAGWEEIPTGEDLFGILYQKGDTRIYLDHTGVFVYRKGQMGHWWRVFGQAFDRMPRLEEGILEHTYSLDLMSGVLINDIFPVVD